MPFKSKKQEAWAFATKQPFAKKWAGMTKQSSLPSGGGGGIPKTPQQSSYNGMLKNMFKGPK